jgi:hypothetical protein
MKVRSLIISGIVIAAAILSAVVLMGAGEGGAVTLQSPKAILTGAVSYTTPYTMAGVYVGGYGSTQWQFGVVVSDVQVSTATIQFSNQVVDCSAVTLWTPTVWVLDADGSTFGVMSSVLMVTGSTSAIGEVPNWGRCARLLITSDNTYTPSLYIRMINSFK